MSWMKKRGQATPVTTGAPPVQMYNPQQHSNQEWQQSSNWYTQPSPATTQKQQNYPPQHQTYWQQPYSQFQHNQTGYYQQHPQNAFDQQQQSYQQASYNYTQTQAHPITTQAQYAQPNEGSDAWNWGWGDEDNSNNQNQTQGVAQTQNESFNNDQSWNWNVDDASASANQMSYNKDLTDGAVVVNSSANPADDSEIIERPAEEIFPTVGDFAKKKLEDTPKNGGSIAHVAAPVTTAHKGRSGSSGLTPQWSIESQMSQESSDDVLPTSESDKSRGLSRSSTVSQSPVSSTGHERLSVPLKTTPEIQENREIPSTYGNSPSPKSHATPPPPPPTGGIDSSGSRNPFKRTAGIAATHKATNSSTSGGRPPYYQYAAHAANMETLPDNSEAPDGAVAPPPSKPPPTTYQAAPAAPEVPSDVSGTPMNDRNQYLVTGQLSEPMPPPGLSRMVLGDEEDAHGSVGGVGDGAQLGDRDEPPPGLSRMVLGETRQGQQMGGVPAGLMRMVPGESSSETRYQRNRSPPLEYGGDASDPELRQLGVGDGQAGDEATLQPRSATTIGADTPPTGTSEAQIETAASQDDVNDGDDAEWSTLERQTTEGAVDTSDGVGGIADITRPDSIEGGRPQEDELNNLVTSVRDMTMGGEDTTEGGGGPGSLPPSAADSSRRHSRQDTSSSEEEDDRRAGVESPTGGMRSHQLPPTGQRHSREGGDRRTGNDRRGYDRRDEGQRKDRERDRERGGDRQRGYSPDYKRNDTRRRYRGDRRYDYEDTDYLSDRDERAADRGRRMGGEAYVNSDQQRKYYSLQRSGRPEKDRSNGGRRRGDRYDRYGARYDRSPTGGGYDDAYSGDEAGLRSASRPSSRSDSMHEAYVGGGRTDGVPRGGDGRRRDHREREHHRRSHRDPYAGYMQGYAYDPYNPYQYQQYQYQYLENLRRTNPQAYAEWYRKYYQHQQQQQQQQIHHQSAASSSVGGIYAASNVDERASVHSGRSSANDELAKERYLRQSAYYAAANHHQLHPSAYGYSPLTPSAHSAALAAHYLGHADDASSLRGTDYGRADTSLNFDDSSLTQQEQRLTPAKFSTAHVKATISAAGQLITLLPNYPSDGLPATVEISTLRSALLDDDELDELLRFPGPLIKGTTHKKTVIEYCEAKIKQATEDSSSLLGVTDLESYVLLWELMILLLRQNGMVVGTDIAELLMKSRNGETQTHKLRPSASVDSVGSNRSGGHHNLNDITQEGGIQTPMGGHLKEDVVTDKFREFLLYGSGKEALEWAMKHGLWGHALFLASKLDKRTYANVMMRFANGLPMNDPLQTLYQLLSGRMPASVTSVSEEKWGDWRPHLAMILSNTSQRPDLDRKAISTLADTLAARGSLCAAHFCYLMAETGFGRFGDTDSAKLVLLGADHKTNADFNKFATNEAIHLTEVYEYACSLNDDAYYIPEFQVYKYLVATRLADRGLVEKALGYLERVTSIILRHPSAARPGLVSRVCDLAERLKHFDLTAEEQDLMDGSFDEGGVETTDDLNQDVDDQTPMGGNVEGRKAVKGESAWLRDLKVVREEYNMGLIVHESVPNLNDVTPEADSTVRYQEQVMGGDVMPPTPSHEAWQHNVNAQEQYMQQTTQWQQGEQLHVPAHQTTDAMQHQEQNETYNQYDQSQETYWVNNQSQAWAGQTQPMNAFDANRNATDQSGQEFTPQHQQLQQQHQQQQNNYWSNANEATEDGPVAAGRPQISMPNQSKSRLPGEDAHETASEPKTGPTQQQKGGTAPASGSSSGWFGGIWSKLALRPKNQMKLPDDKNPTIVWDSEKKRWVNLEDNGTETAHELKPPPKMSDMMSKIADRNQNSEVTSVQSKPTHNSAFGAVQNTTAQRGRPQVHDEGGNEPIVGGKPPLPNNNMFKLQRGRNLKKSYIDLFNPTGGGNNTMLPPLGDPNTALHPQQQQHMQFFTPAPVNDPNAPVDFLTPAPSFVAAPDAQMSRWSSSSSLSKEVQQHMKYVDNPMIVAQRR